MNRCRLPDFPSISVHSYPFAVLLIIIAAAMVHAADRPAADRFADPKKLVAETHATSLEQREQALRNTISKDTCWPEGVWGETLWTLAALRLNEKTAQANARLLQRARDYIALNRKGEAVSVFIPEDAKGTPWAYFALTDYVRILCLFRDKSPHFPGRLTPETEAAMKEALWLWVRTESRVADAGLDDLFLLLGTENHDLTLRPNHYLITALLKDDPAYQNQKLADGHTPAEHTAAYTAFFREWPRRRAGSGMWIEVGSNGYQKYSWPALFNLHELAPDPVIRERFGLLLDLALIEEAQISVKGKRGGGRSRASYGKGGFESLKSLIYGEGGGSSHSRVLETSLYQAPPEAILLRKREFPAARPFVIRNRVLGRIAPPGPEGGHRIAADSALVNYAYRTPHYLLGSTLQNPALEYSGISRQNRTCGLLFDDPSAAKISQIHPVAEHIGGGRSQHSYWSVQHENVLIFQRIARVGKGHPGSYNTGRLGMRFDGKNLKVVEESGWIFATSGKAFVGVKFLDGKHQWDEKLVEAFPADFTGQDDTTRILLHCGDLSSDPSFESFRAKLLSNPLAVTAEKVDYRFGAGKNHLKMSRYDAKSPESFTLPLINGTPVDLSPATTYQSPYLNGKFGGDRIAVTVGLIQRTLDFSEQGE